MATLHEAAFQGTLLTPNKLDKYRQDAAAAGEPFNIDELDNKGRTALGYAAWKGHTSVVKMLVAQGADPNKLGRGDRSPLWYAAAGAMGAHERREIIEFLIEHKAEVNEQAADGYTPLMKVIVDHRDADLAAFLVDKGASTKVCKGGASGPNAEELAARTKDAKLMRALKPKAERRASNAQLVDLIVGAITFVLERVNSPMVTGIVNGVAKKMYGISGQDNPEIRAALGTQGPQTVEEFKKDIGRYVNETGLSEYFAEDDPFLESVAEKAASLREDPSNPLRTDDDIRNLTKLALYQPVLYCDDSGSMGHGSRAEDQRELVRRIARIATRLVPDGYGASLQFINHVRELDDNLGADEVEEIVAQVDPSSSTPIGTNLKTKILDPLVYNVLSAPGGKLKRPILVCCITDGRPSDEATDMFRKNILRCRAFVENKNYKGTAVRFMISQIGNDQQAGEFLNTLRGDATLEEILYVTAQRLDDEYKKLRENDEDLERWLLKVMMSPITDRMVA